MQIFDMAAMQVKLYMFRCLLDSIQWKDIFQQKFNRL